MKTKNTGMRLHVDGATLAIARSRLTKVLTGTLGLRELQGGLPTAVTASDEVIKFNPFTDKETPNFGESHFEASLAASEEALNFVQASCPNRECGTVSLSTDKPMCCAQCGTNLDGKFKQLEISLNNGDNDMRVKSRNKSTAADDDQVAIEDLEDSGLEVEAGDEDTFEEDFEGGEDDVEDVEDDSLDIEEDVEDDIEASDDDSEEESDDVEDDIDDDDIEDDIDDDDVEDAPVDGDVGEGEKVLETVSSSRMIVASRTLNGAIRKFARVAVASVEASSKGKAILASNRRVGGNKLTASGIVVAQCEVCSFHVIASDEVKKVECSNCDARISRSALVASALEIDPDGDDDIEIVDEAQEDDISEEAGDDLDLAEDEDVEDDVTDDVEDEEEDVVAGDGDGLEDFMADDEEEEDVDMVESSSKKTKPARKAKKTTAGDDVEDVVEDDVSDDLDLAETTQVEPTDNLELSYVVSASGGGNRWQLSCNNLPIAVLSRENVRGELKTLAGENLNNPKFASALSAAVMADKQKAVANALAMGFKGVVVPVFTDKIIASKANQKILAATKDMQKTAASYGADLRKALTVAAQAMNKGWNASVRHPIKDALMASMQASGVPRATKIVHEAFANNSDKFIDTLVAEAHNFMSKSPEARREIAASVGQIAYQAEALDSGEEDEEDGDTGNGILDAMTATNHSSPVESATVASGAPSPQTIRSLLNFGRNRGSR